MTKALACATVTGNSSPPPQTKNTPKSEPTTLPSRKKQPLQQRRPQQPSIVQIERAIGAGSFRDADSTDLDRRKTVFDGLLPITTGKFEGAVEKQLRKTGEWISSNTEAKFRSSGKMILMFVLKWMLPIWTLSLLVASGVIKLPWTSPLLDDLIM
ncbi:hypothetical protein SLEP1_g11064 [Rubroshorea leprosula]|uniref:Chlororespiratory reduction 3 n=1 Tax=Rubroshorea leprosula TaxID=152421 RepID=A0AAV5IEL7_9ROSI|nr:hypothetical protein SLEP1_g11064 [Rubroshorea leprosula]